MPEIIINKTEFGSGEVQYLRRDMSLLSHILGRVEDSEKTIIQWSVETEVRVDRLTTEEVSRFGLEEIIGKRIYMAHILMRQAMEQGVPYPSSENHIFSPKSNVECYSVSSMGQSVQIGQGKHKNHGIICQRQYEMHKIH